MTRRTLITGCVALMVATTASCHTKQGKSCTLDTDCAQGLFCWLYTNTCEQPCNETAECDTGQLCMCEPDRECPRVDEGTPLDDIQGGACLAPASGDAETEDGVGDVTVDPDATPDILDTVEEDTPLDPPPDTADTTGTDCVWDGTADPLPDGGCVVPDTFTEPTFRAYTFQIGTDGNPGSGLDLDSNPSTCSPQSNPEIPDAQCSGGVENALWALGLLANDYLTSDIDAGQLNILVELPGYTDDGCVFTMNYFRGTRVPADPPQCPEETVCDYTIYLDSFTDDCRAVSLIPGATVTGTHLSAGPSPDVYYLTLVVVGLDLVIPVHDARFEGEVIPGSSGPDGFSGIIGGYVSKSEFLAVLEAIPSEDYPVPGKEAVLEMINQLWELERIVNDRDLDGDTVMDAASVGVIIEAEPASIVGMES